MSMVAYLYKEDMDCQCPSCQEYVSVSEGDFHGNMVEGFKEYQVRCPHCDQSFYVSEYY